MLKSINRKLRLFLNYPPNLLNKYMRNKMQAKNKKIIKTY